MCTPEPVTAKLGIFGRIIDPGLATSELVGKIAGKRVGNLLNPGKFLDALSPEPAKAPVVDRTPKKTGQQIADEKRPAVLAEQNEERKRAALLQPSLLQSIQDGADIAGNDPGRATGTQKLDSVIARGRRTFLN